jgi:mannose-6-phosphate isomerase-like protein (cupin superfamily)
MHKMTGNIDARNLIAPSDGEPFAFGPVGGRFKIDGSLTGNRFTVAHLPELPPRTLGAPLHRHRNEDEYTFVVTGSPSVMLDGEVISAEPGMWIIKPRGLWHTFWNARKTPCSIIEVVSPAGFERYFREIAEAPGDVEHLARVNKAYAIDMDLESVAALCERFGLAFPKM